MVGGVKYEHTHRMIAEFIGLLIIAMAVWTQRVEREDARAKAQAALIAAQAKRDRLGELERDLAFRVDQLNARQKMAAQARLQSKLTFANISVLDKAVPPIAPSFPKPSIVIPVGVAAGLALGLLLALIAEATDRRVRVLADLEFAASRPVLGVIQPQTRRMLSANRRRKLPHSA